MKMAGNIVFFVFLLILSPPVLWPQNSPLAADPVFRSAREAQQEGRIADAEKILNDRIHAIEQTQPNSTELVPYLNLLASIYFMKQQSSDAHAIYERVLEIDRSAYGPSDSRSVRDLINVASFLGPEKKEQQEQLLNQALELALHDPEPTPAAIAEALAHLAGFYEAEQRWYDAETVAQQGLKLCASASLLPGPCQSLQRTLATVYRNEGRTVEGEQAASRGMDANLPAELAAVINSAKQYEKDGLYAQAEFNYRQAAAYIEAHTMWNEGKIPLDLTGMLSTQYDGMARVLEKQGRDALAEESYKKAIALKEASAPEHSVSVRSFNFSGLMNLYRKQGRLNELEPIIGHALELQEKFIGESSTNVAQTLVMYGNLYKDEGKYVEAKPIYERAIKIQEANFGPNDRQLHFALTFYADLLRKMHEDAKAAEIQARIKEIEKNQPER